MTGRAVDGPRPVHGPDKEMRSGTPLWPDLTSRSPASGPVKTRAGPTVPGGYREVRHPALAGPHALLSG